MLRPPAGEPGCRSLIEAESSAVWLSSVWQGLSGVDAAKSGAICSLRPLRQATPETRRTMQVRGKRRRCPLRPKVNSSITAMHTV